MGEMADYIINGDDCQVCGVPFMDGEAPGYPRTCNGCQCEERLEKSGQKKKRRSEKTGKRK